MNNNFTSESETASTSNEGVFVQDEDLMLINKYFCNTGRFAKWDKAESASQGRFHFSDDKICTNLPS